MTITDYSPMTDKITTFITYASAGVAFFLSFINSYAAALGVLIGVFTLIMNWWFKWQHLKLAKNKKSLGDQDGD